jgi:hypothetical protein
LDRRHLVDGHRKQHLALMCGQLDGDQASDGSGELFDLSEMLRIVVRHRVGRPVVSLGRQLTRVSQSNADLTGDFDRGEPPCPGGEPGVAAKVVELGEERDEGIVRSLHGEVFEVAA